MQIAETVKLTVNGTEVTVPTGLFINGLFVKSHSGRQMPVENPATGEQILSVEEADAVDVDLAVATARAAFDNGTWAFGDPTFRAKCLFKLADLMDSHKEELCLLESVDTGKVLKTVQALDFPASVATVRYYAGWADKIEGISSSNIPGTMAYTRKEPIGVCGQILPFNYPLLMFTWKLAPALATGCTVVMKTSETTNLSALKVCELMVKAGFPPGVFNSLAGYGKIAGAAIAHHMDVDKVAFTGSGPTGRAILRASADSNLKKVTLELGGKSPNIIFNDADLDKAVQWAAWGINMNMGQVCHAGTRVYVQSGIYPRFLEAFKKKLSQNQIGDPLHPETNHGPQNSELAYNRIMNYIKLGVDEGATIELGGKAVEGTKGYFIEPTIMTNVKADMRIMREEVFGPFVCIDTFETEAEVIAKANDTKYGLAAAVFTSDHECAIRVVNKLKAGTTWVNMYNFVHWTIPFGGYKESGIGRECGEAVLENYTQTKAVYFSAGIKPPF